MKAALVKTDVKEEGVQVQTKVLPRVQNKGIDRQVVGKGRAAVGGSTSHVQDDDKPILDYMLNQKNIQCTKNTDSTKFKDIFMKNFSGKTNSKSDVTDAVEKAKAVKETEKGNLANCDAATCVDLLRNPAVENIFRIKNLMQDANKEWLEDFLILDGLDVLFETLELLKDRGTSYIYNANLQLQVVMCVRAVMNSESGLEHIINSDNYTRKLAKGMYRNIFYIFINFELDFIQYLGRFI